MFTRETKIYMAYRVAQKRFAKTDKILANFRAVMYVSKQFHLPYLQVQTIVKSHRKSK